MRGLYVHIPFCVGKCFYCDFYSVAAVPELMDRYIDALMAEADSYRGMCFNTLYVGGGTPSILGVERLQRLVRGLHRRFALDNLKEATIEVNPESTSEDLLGTIYRLGFNRISIGVQSLNGDELLKSGRAHNRQEALRALEIASSAGFHNISTDIMIGLPGQTAPSLEETLNNLINRGASHISAYCLSIEEGTPFHRCPPSGLPCEDEQADLYECAVDVLCGHGMVHYEISNFARPGRQCLHNLNYWRGGEYLGLGPAVASHIDGERFRNAADLERYLSEPLNVREGAERLNDDRKAGEEAMLRLRLIQEGLDIRDISGRYGCSVAGMLESRLNKLVRCKSLVREGNIFRLHPACVLTSNSVFAEVLE